MFEESDDDELPRTVADELETLGKTVTSDAAELNQLIRTTCEQLGGPFHLKADQTLGLIVSSHAVRLLPTVWTVLLQKLKDCTNVQSRVAVVAHFANVSDRVAARQRPDAFRVFAKEALALYGCVDTVSDRRFAAASLSLLKSLGLHGSQETCEALQMKVLDCYFLWTRADARRNAASIAIALSRWTRHCGRVVDLFGRVWDREGVELGSVAAFMDQGMAALVSQSELVSSDPASLPAESALVDRLCERLIKELNTETKGAPTAAAALASAIAKAATVHPPSEQVGAEIASKLMAGVKPILVCPLLTLLNAALHRHRPLHEAAASVARRFVSHDDMLVRQVTFSLLGTSLGIAADVSRAANDWQEECATMRAKFRLYSTDGDERCSTTLAAILNAAGVVFQNVSATAFADAAQDMLSALDQCESMATSMPEVQEAMVRCLGAALVVHADDVSERCLRRIARFVGDAGLLSRPEVATALVDMLLNAAPQLCDALSPVSSAIQFMVEGVDPQELRCHRRRPGDDRRLVGRLLAIVDAFFSSGDSDQISVAVAILESVCAHLVVHPELQCFASLFLRITDTILGVTNSPATSSVEVTCELLRALRFSIPFNPHQDVLTDAFRLCGTLLRRCANVLEPEGAPTSPKRPTGKVAGTLLEDVELVAELCASVSNSAQAHLATSDTSASPFAALIAAILDCFATIAENAHGLFRDAYQLQCAPLLGHLDTTATVAPNATIDCAYSVFTYLFSDREGVVKSEKVTVAQRRTRVVQMSVTALNRALTFDLTVVCGPFLDMVCALADADATCNSAEESCYLAFDPELAALRRFVNLVTDPKCFSYAWGPALLASLMCAIDAVLPLVRRLLPKHPVIKEITEMPSAPRDVAAAEATALWNETRADAFLAVLGKTPADIDRAAAAHVEPLLDLATRSQPVRECLAAALGASAGVSPRLAAKIKSYDLPDVPDVPVANPPHDSAAALAQSSRTADDEATQPSGTWQAWCATAELPVSERPAGDPSWSECLQLSSAELIALWHAGVSLPAVPPPTLDDDDDDSDDVGEDMKASSAVRASSASTSAAMLTFLGDMQRRAGSAASGDTAAHLKKVAPSGSTFCAFASVAPAAGSLLAALPVDLVDNESAGLQPMHILAAIEHASTPAELDLWLTAAAALEHPTTGAWRRRVVRAAAARTYFMQGQVRPDSTEQIAVIAEFLSAVAAENEGDNGCLCAIALVAEWLKPGRCGLWCWEDAWSELPDDLQTTMAVLFRRVIGIVDDAPQQALGAALVRELLGKSRLSDPFRTSLLFIVARCLSGLVCRTLVSNEVVPLANPRVFDVITEVIYTVGINEEAAQTLHAEITPMLVDERVMGDYDFRDAVLRCSTALAIALAEERRTRPPAHCGLSDFQSLCDDYPLKRMTAEGAEAIFDTVHSEAFAPAHRSDWMPVRHWNQFRRESLALNPAENTVDPALRDRLCTGILNFMIPILGDMLHAEADVLDVWTSLSFARLLATKCTSQLRRTQLMNGSGTAASFVLGLCTSLVQDEFASELLKGAAAHASAQQPLEMRHGLPVPRTSTCFHDTHTASSILMIYSAGLRSAADSDEVKAATAPAVVVRAALRSDWLSLGPGLCALTGFASGPKAEQAVAISYIVDRAPLLLSASNKAPLAFVPLSLLTLRTGFAFMAASPDHAFVTHMSRHALRHVATNPSVRSARLKAYAFFMLQSIIGMQAVSEGETQWATLRKSLRDAAQATLQGSEVATGGRDDDSDAAVTPTVSQHASTRSLSDADLEAAGESAAGAGDGSDSEAALSEPNLSFSTPGRKLSWSAQRSSVDSLHIVATEATFVLRALTSYATGEARDRTTSTVLDLHAALRQREGYSMPHAIVVQRLLKQAMPPNERMFLALNQFTFAPIAMLGAIDALRYATPTDTAELLSQLNLFVGCVSQHAKSAPHVWWTATTMLWMAVFSVDPHVHRAVGRMLTRLMPPMAQATLGRATSLWLASARPKLHRSVLTVLDQQIKTMDTAESRDMWRAVSVGLRL